MKQNLKILIVLIIIGLTNKTFCQVTFGKNGTFSNKWYNGNLILKNNDTLNGLIKFESTSKNLLGLNSISGDNAVFFKKSENSKKQKFKKEQVKYFIIKNNSNKTLKYEYVNTDEKKLKLLQVLIEGKVNLYLKRAEQDLVLDNSTPSEINQTIFKTQRNFYYVKKEKDKYVSNRFFTNAFKSFKKTAKEYLSDCTSVVNKINNDTYKWEDLYAMISEYNNCK